MRAYTSSKASSTVPTTTPVIISLRVALLVELVEA
jgi:hypothetical protein